MNEVKKRTGWVPPPLPEEPDARDRRVQLAKNMRALKNRYAPELAEPIPEGKVAVRFSGKDYTAVMLKTVAEIFQVRGTVRILDKEETAAALREVQAAITAATE